MVTNQVFPRLLLLALGLLVCASLPAAKLPEWEAGIGLAPVYIPDYRGSAHYRAYALPFPYMVYRGEKLTMDRRGIRGILFESERVYFDLSMNASVPVNSRDNEKRRGMPDLDPAFQIGPSLQVNLYGRDTSRRYINFALPVRKVISTDFSHFEGEGYIAQPQLNFNYGKTVATGYWSAGLSMSLLYADRQYHDYYFSVADQYATPERPAYQADSGYSGERLTLTFTGRHERYWLGTFVLYDHIANATFADSPLVERDYSFIVGLAVAWVFGESSNTVEAMP